MRNFIVWYDFGSNNNPGHPLQHSFASVLCWKALLFVFFYTWSDFKVEWPDFTHPHACIKIETNMKQTKEQRFRPQPQIARDSLPPIQKTEDHPFLVGLPLHRTICSCKCFWVIADANEYNHKSGKIIHQVQKLNISVSGMRNGVNVATRTIRKRSNCFSKLERMATTR